MSRLLLAALAALLLLVPATAAGSSSAQLRGTVAQTLPDNNLIRVDSRRTAHILRVTGSQARIRVGQRVELRGTTLRKRGSGSHVLARNVVVVRSVASDTGPASRGTLGQRDDSNGRDDGKGDNSGPGKGDDDDDDNSGPGRGDDDDDDSTDDSLDDDTTDDDDTDDDSTDDD